MKSSRIEKPVSVVMYIASFYPQPMGGMEMQGFRLAQQLINQGTSVTIFTHGFKNCKREEIYGGIRIIRLHSWLNNTFETILSTKNKFISKNDTLDLPSSERVKTSLPYDTSDTGIRINGNLADLVYYIIQTFNFAWSLRKKCRQANIIHVHGMPWVSFVGVRVGRFYKIPVIVKESTTIGLKKYDDIVWGNRMRRYVLKYAYFVAISKYIYQVILKYGVLVERVYYVPNGTTIPLKPAEETINKLNVLFVGNLTQGAAKGLDILLQAWAVVIEKYPDAKLLIAGHNDNPESWLRYLTNLRIEKNVVFLGNKNKINEMFEQTTIYVSPSRREGLSNALLEAMAFGLPCIVTNISGSQDMIEDGVNGYVVEPDNAAELADAILSMLSSKTLRKTMREKNYAKVKATCSFERITKEYQRIYYCMLNRTNNENPSLKN